MMGSFIVFYAVCLFALITKWILQAPFALLVSQISLYLVNSIDTDMEKTKILGVLLVNSLLPVLMTFISYSLFHTKVSLYLSKMSGVMSQIEMKNILKMIP